MAEINKQHPLYQEDLQYILKTDGFEQLHGKRFLITGATGLLGTCLIDALMLANQQGAEIDTYAVGRSKEKATPRLGEYYDDTHFHFLEQDVRRPFPTLLQVDYIIPLASNTHPLAYAQYPIETIDINVLGASNALQMAVEQGATVLYPSSVEVYGNARGNDQFTEDYTGQLNLSTARACYTESKRLSEALCQSYIAERGANVKIARLSRIFGPTMLMSDSKASSQFLLKALNDEDIVLKSKGEQLYSYTYAADAVSALLYILLHGTTGTPYNVACEACNVQLKAFAKYCAEWAQKEVVFDLPSETEQKGYSVATRALLDTKRLQALGWAPHYAMQEAVNRTLSILRHEE
ncbi:MAG: NAD-dependent epimerase/dehydratase family protein [Prevotella sp.]|nr:NAD-dependent epimerase/dehydratase family protein [Prevotella sp.]